MDEESGWINYGYRNYNPVIGRFDRVDDLASAYSYLSPYAYAENQPIWAIDLDGLEKFISIGWNDAAYRGPLLNNHILEVTNVLTVGENEGGVTMLNVLKSQGEEIGFLAIFSHGTANGIFNSQDKFTQRGFYLSNLDFSTTNKYSTSLDNLAKEIADGKITFAPGAVIFLGGCNLGTTTVDFTNGVETSFAQKLANITNASVIAVNDDQVVPSNPNTERQNMNYSPNFGATQNTQFYSYNRDQNPEPLGRVVSAINAARFGIQRTSYKMTAIAPKSYNSGTSGLGHSTTQSEPKPRTSTHHDGD